MRHMIGFDFQPDPERARAINARMHRELAASLRHVTEEAARPLGVDTCAIMPLIAELEAGVSYPAITFADYYDLVIAIEEDAFDEARRIFGELCRARPAPAGLRVDTLGSSELGDKSARYET